MLVSTDLESFSGCPDHKCLFRPLIFETPKRAQVRENLRGGGVVDTGAYRHPLGFSSMRSVGRPENHAEDGHSWAESRYQKQSLDEEFGPPPTALT